VEEEKSMTDAGSIWESKRSRLQEPKMKPLTDLVERLRKEAGEKVPYFDPDDGGVDAEVLLLFQDPGPTVKESDFISRDNYPFDPDDHSAMRVIEASVEANLDRKRTVSWNTVPWQVDEDRSLRKEITRVKRERRLTELLEVFEGRNLKAVALFGNPAKELEGQVREARPDLEIFKDYHPSDRGVSSKEKKEHFKETFREIKYFLDR
jgi:hypothetical protein